jgi:hypothetical protein
VLLIERIRGGGVLLTAFDLAFEVLEDLEGDRSFASAGAIGAIKWRRSTIWHYSDDHARSPWGTVMITAAKLAGFFAAHAIWCISNGETLTPMLAYTNAKNERQLVRLVAKDLAASVALGKQKLRSNDMDANDAAFLFDGYIPLEKEKTHAVIIEIRAYFSPSSEAVIAIPYTPRASGRFLVHKPKLLTWKRCADFDKGVAVESFFVGVDEHEVGSKIWKESLDESR